jgi:DNA-binding transcriptional regulator YiaG
VADLVKEALAERELPSPDFAAAIRRLAGVSQGRLATELGVHRVTVARWEAGTRAPRGTLRRRYALLLQELQRAVLAPLELPRGEGIESDEGRPAHSR